MFEIRHWRRPGGIRVARSASGVVVTTHPDDNLVRATTEPWPTPELLQKYCASARFRGATAEEDFAARSGLGHYCDLQSLNSEDAVTWSVFGSLSYLPEPERGDTIARLFERIELTRPSARVGSWVWRRLPHPEKPESNGGPEIDFGFLSSDVLVLGEAKWNSRLGKGQGIAGNKTQLDLRLAYCSKLGKLALPHARQFVVLGIARKGVLLQTRDELDESIIVKNLTWADVVECFRGALGEELGQYLEWRTSLGRPVA